MLKELMEAIELGYKEIRDEQDRIRESEARKLREEEERNQKKLNQFPEWMHPYGKVIFQDFLQVDTTNILFICGGAFAGLEKVIENRTEASGIGFGATVKSKESRSLSEVFGEVEPADIIKFGLIPELVGRMPVVATLVELTEDALVQILTEPKNALVKQYSKLLSMEGAELEIRPAALRAIAKKALARKTGARGLRSILEQSLIDTMYELPNSPNVEKVVVEEATIEENKPPLLVYREAAKKA